MKNLIFLTALVPMFGLAEWPGREAKRIHVAAEDWGVCTAGK